MTKRSSAIASMVTGVAGAGGFLAVDWLLSIGGPNCDVYCGPGSIVLPLVAFVLTFAAWVAAVVFAVSYLRQPESALLAIASLFGPIALPVCMLFVWLVR